MIQSYTNTDQTLSTGGALSFDTIAVKTNCVVSHVAGSTTFSVSKPGYYHVHFDGVGSPSAAGDVEIQLYLNSSPVSYAYSAATAASTDTVELGFDTIVKVPNSCCVVDNSQQLTFVNTGTSTTYNLANVIIEREV